MLKLKFPDNYLELFVPAKGDKSGHVFINFYLWVLKQSLPSIGLFYDGKGLEALLSRLNPGSILVSKEGEEKLKAAFIVWVRQLKGCSKREALLYWPMEHLSYGPACCFPGYRPSWLLEDPDDLYIYIEDEYLFKKVK